VKHDWNSLSDLGERSLRWLNNAAQSEGRVSDGSSDLWRNDYGYNGVGNRVWTRYGGSGANGDVYQYDDNDQVIGVKYGASDVHLGYAAADSPTSTSTLSYDAAGNRLTQVKGPDMTAYSVNAINQYTSLTQNSGAPETLSYTARGDLKALDGVDFEYDTFGHLFLLC